MLINIKSHVYCIQLALNNFFVTPLIYTRVVLFILQKLYVVIFVSLATMYKVDIYNISQH